MDATMSEHDYEDWNERGRRQLLAVPLVFALQQLFAVGVIQVIWCLIILGLAWVAARWQAQWAWLLLLATFVLQLLWALIWGLENVYTRGPTSA